MLIAEPDDLNIGWTVRQSFIDSLNSGNPDAVSRFKRALKVKVLTGKGYFFFPDKANQQRPQMYVDKGLFINNSQLCTEIMLFNDHEHTYTCQPGFAPIIKKDIGLTTLENIEVGDEIWSKQGWTKVVDKKSSGVKPVNKYKTNIGSFIGTKDHRIVQNNEKVEVQNAKSIDGVKYTYQHDVTILPEYVMQGLLIGDGTIRNNKVCLCVGEKDQDYYNSEVSNMIDVDGYSYFRNVKTDITFLKNTFDRDIDISQLDSSSKTASLLRGLYSANGSAIKQQDGRVHVILTASSEKVAYKTQLLLQSLGLSPKMYKTNGKQNSFNNGVYNCKDVYRVVIIRQSDVEYFNQNIGFIQQYKTNILKNMKTSLPKKRKLSGEIYDVEYLGDYEVFHIEVENSTHTYWTGGLDVSNCVLSSMNVSLWDEWKDTDAVYWATIFLDCVVSEFLERAKNLPGLEKAVRFTEKGRALGLGQAGLHTLFMKNMIPFESFEAHMLSNKIAKHIQSQAIEATKNMAINLGEPYWCFGYGVRNTHLIAIAPTKSTALIMGGISEGVGPDPAMSFTQMTAAGEVDRLNPVLLDLMKQKDVFTPKNVKEITEAQGSVQGVDWLTEDEKKVFKTAFEINQQAITRLAGTRQHFVDQGQSINYFFSADENEEYIASIFQEVFEHPQMLSAYYAYMMAGVTASKDTCEACM